MTAKGKGVYQKDGCEIRSVTVQAAASDIEEKMTLTGYAVRFETPASYENFGRNGERYTETIQRGALDRTDMSGVVLRYNHADSVMAMARTKNGSLRLTVDEFGLKIEADLIDTQVNRDLYRAVQAGLIDKMSFAFVVRDGGSVWRYSKEEIRRDITDIEKIYDVSIVDEPFYAETDVSARMRETVDAELRRLDDRKGFNNDVLRLQIALKGKV